MIYLSSETLDQTAHPHEFGLSLSQTVLSTVFDDSESESSNTQEYTVWNKMTANALSSVH